MGAGVHEVHEGNAANCQDFVLDGQEKGWEAWLFPVELGFEYMGKGTSRKERKTVAHKIEEATERVFCWIWHRREDVICKSGDDGQ